MTNRRFMTSAGGRCDLYMAPAFYTEKGYTLTFLTFFFLLFEFSLSPFNRVSVKCSAAAVRSVSMSTDVWVV